MVGSAWKHISGASVMVQLRVPALAQRHSPCSPWSRRASPVCRVDQGRQASSELWARHHCCVFEKTESGGGGFPMLAMLSRTQSEQTAHRRTGIVDLPVEVSFDEPGLDVQNGAKVKRDRRGAACPGPSGIAQGEVARHLPVTRCKGHIVGECDAKALRFDQAGITPTTARFGFESLLRIFVTEHQTSLVCTISEALTAPKTESLKRWQAVVGTSDSAGPLVLCSGPDRCGRVPPSAPIFCRVSSGAGQNLSNLVGFGQLPHFGGWGRVAAGAWWSSSQCCLLYVHTLH